MQKTCSKTLSKNNLVGGNGALGVLENLLFCLFNPGDRIALLTPCYPQHRSVLSFRNQLETLEVDSFELLLEAIAARKVAGVLWTNPSNPCGTVYTREMVAQLVSACSRHHVHLISDEVYASCVFDSKMIDVLNFCSSNEDNNYVHVVTGLAKLGFSGAKIGFVYSENPALVKVFFTKKERKKQNVLHSQKKTLRAMSRLSPIATPGAVAATRLLCAEVWWISFRLFGNCF